MEEALTTALAAFLGGLLSYGVARRFELLGANLRMRTRRKARTIACLHHDDHISGTRMVDGVKHKVFTCSRCPRTRTEAV